jgi:hypothetical protein
MSWITATTIHKRRANLQTHTIAAILERVAGTPQEGSEILFSTGFSLEVVESPAELLRAIDTEEKNAPALPTDAW